MAITFGPYFVLTALQGPAESTMWEVHLLSRIASVTLTQMLILGAGHLWLRLSTPEDARASIDERDRSIDRRSTRAAYYVLIAGMILVGVVMPFSESGWAIVNAALAAITLAEVVHYSVAVHSYRGAWHA